MPASIGSRSAEPGSMRRVKMPGDYKAEQVGSFLRPPEVLEAHAAFEKGELAVEKLREIEDKAILELLEMERAVGIDVLSDGEYRRAAWAGDFPDSVDGYVDGTSPITFTWRRDTEDGVSASPAGPPTINTLGRVIGAKLRRKHRMTAHEAGFLKEHAGGRPFKVTMP